MHVADRVHQDIDPGEGVEIGTDRHIIRRIEPRRRGPFERGEQLGIDVAGVDLGAFSHQSFGDRAADALAGSRDHGNAPCQTSRLFLHGETLLHV